MGSVIDYILNLASPSIPANSQDPMRSLSPGGRVEEPPKSASFAFCRHLLVLVTPQTCCVMDADRDEAVVVSVFLIDTQAQVSYPSFPRSDFLLSSMIHHSMVLQTQSKSLPFGSGGLMNTRRRIQSNGLMQISLLSLFFVFIFMVDSTSFAESETADETDLIQINLEATRPELTVGTGLGITAEITNTSKKNAIYLSEKDLTLTPAPELTSATGELVNWWAYFPDMERTNYYKADWMEEGRYYAIAELKPGEKITAFWWTAAKTEAANSKPRSAVGQAIREVWATVLSELKFIFFAPGDYKVTVSSIYWVHPEKPGSQNYHHAVQSKMFHASAPQSVILFGAALGGLFAYFIHPQARRRLIDSAPSGGRAFVYEATRRIFQEIGGAFAAILLSTIVTILLSRISDTQFFIRVSVSDLWGAITIGFVANYAGSTILAKILKKVSAADTEVEVTKPAVQEQGAKPVDTH